MNIQTLRSTAISRLSTAPYSPHRLALVHTGAAIALSLALTLLNYLLTRQMAHTGGLSGIGTRTILSAAQMLLTIAGAVAMPFWDFGFTRAALNISRGERATPATLLTGFRRFGPVLRLLLLKAGLTMLVTFVCLQAATILFMLSPWSLLTMQTAEQLLAAGVETLDETAIWQMMNTMYPLYILIGALLCLVLVPILYRFRLTDWAVADGSSKVLKAMAHSAYWMHGKRLWLFRLDLRFWWYYALQLAATALTYGDLLLPVLGISIHEDVAFFGFFLLSAGLQLLVAWRFAPQVATTYALAYDALRAEKPPVNPAQQPITD